MRSAWHKLNGARLLNAALHTERSELQDYHELSAVHERIHVPGNPIHQSCCPRLGAGTATNCSSPKNQDASP
eukprot:2243415-Amphidinium_carterae.1